MKNLDIKELLVNIKKIKFRHDFRTISDKAHFDWKIMVFGFILAIFAIVLVGFILFVQVSSIETRIAPNVGGDKDILLDETKLQNALDKYRQKKMPAEGQVEYVEVSDPSL
jgi:uncharacterized membrane protein YraQ (UPF0718 family)